MIIEILAHRANIAGPDPDTENSLAACEAALKKGFGLEIDLRRDEKSRFYISHDPVHHTSASDLAAYEALFRRHPDLTIAVNVKELGYEDELIRLQRAGTFGRRDFYFDFELLEKERGGTRRTLAALPGGDALRVAARLSDRNEPLGPCLALPSYAVWADEFDSLWLTEKQIRAVRDAGRRVYLISPELHGFSATQRRERWAQFKQWGIDGLCTDYALEARDFFGQ